jgi:DNA-binding XRE family transcriptional regulator
MTLALASMSDVYGIRRLKFDHAVQTLRVEYDATRLSAATVTGLIRQTGLAIEQASPLPLQQPAAPVA